METSTVNSTSEITECTPEMSEEAVNVKEEQTFEMAVAKEASDRNRNLKWEKLPKFSQWKVFKAYMHENGLTDGRLFKKMRSMISEKRTETFVEYDVTSQKITNVDFKNEVFIRERSKKKKLQVQLANAVEEEDIKSLEAAISGLKMQSENVEVVFEDNVKVL
jgi:hypothetical protein